MAQQDKVYYFTKDTFKKVLYGEVQKGFNLSFVIDGTKDSAKLIVFSYDETEIEPMTIVYHEKTSTWWVVSHDKVERYANEIGFLYKHNVQLLGAIELLNARDLTDCGYNQDKYDIGSFISRLCKLSTWEFAHDNRLSVEIESNSLDITINVDYMKTFENYTLLSALREFLGGYNSDVKLLFDTETDFEKWGDNDEHIYNATIQIIPKTGYVNETPIDENIFSEVKETKTMDKNSFGTTVISNAENVISSKTKTFPNTGAIRLSGSEYEITANNAFLRMPSNIFKVNWLRVFYPITIRVKWDMRTAGSSTIVSYTNTYKLYGFDSDSLNSTFDKIVSDAYENMNVSPFYASGFNQLKEHYYANKDNILKPIILGGRTTLYSGWQCNPVDGTLHAPTNNPDFYWSAIFRHYSDPIVNFDTEWVIADKVEKNNLPSPQRCICYERGKNIIENFEILGAVGSNYDYSYIRGFQYTDLRDSNYNPVGTDQFRDYYNDSFFISLSQFSLVISIQGLSYEHINIGNTYYQVNYIPMSDLKIKYDNSGERNDTQIYNQNGKLNDSVALSKLLLSYSKEIESDTITKYANFYKFSDVPQVGQMVLIGNELYVINNVSLDFYENEEIDNSDYYIVGEFTMSKKTAVKSLLTNPNSNIRDYGIPQNNNVVRKQLYRDFYELGHTLDTNASNDYYLPLNKIMNVSNRYQDYQEHIAVIKLGYSDLVQGKENWYYQLDTTTYILKKAIYEVVNFNDNNIIGYCSQNTLSEFDITRLFTGLIDVKNTPISYTDDNGEVESFDIAFCTNEQLTKVYSNYKKAKGYGSSTKPIFNYSIFIDGDIYNGGDYGQSYSYIGVINSGTLGVDQFNSATFEITQYLDGFTGSETDISIDGLSVYDAFYDREIPSSEYSYSFSKSISGDRYYINMTINPTSTYLTPQVQLNITNVLRGGFSGAIVNNDFIISESNYEKDALEVPFFEYSCQIDDSSDVIIGDNVLDTKDNGLVYMYSYVLVPKNQVNENNFYRYVVEPSGHFDDFNHFIITVPNAISMEYDNNNLKIKVRSNDTYDVISDTYTQGTIQPLVGAFLNQLKTNDIMIVRHKVNKDTKYSGEPNDYTVHPINDLMFILRNTNNATFNSFDISLTINHYRIK